MASAGWWPGRDSNPRRTAYETVLEPNSSPPGEGCDLTDSVGLVSLKIEGLILSILIIHIPALTWILVRVVRKLIE